jgi:hypothetical protein
MAGNASNIRAGGAFVEIGTKDNLSQALARALAKLKAFGAAVSAIGNGIKVAGRFVSEMGTSLVDAGARVLKYGLIAKAALAAAALAYASMGDKIAKASTRTGIAAEALSELAFAADRSAVDFETLEGSVRKMQKTVAAAAVGSAEARLALSRLGLTVADLNGLTPDKMLEKIADGMAGIQDPTARAALALSIFGKTGTAILPLFSDGAKGISRLRAEAARLGLTMSTADAKAAEEFHDRLTDLYRVADNSVFRVGGALAAGMREFAVRTTEILVRVNRWISANRELVTRAAQVTTAVLATGAAMVVLGYGIKLVGGAISGFGSLFTVAGAAIQGLAVGLGLILNPVGLIVAGLAGMAAYFVYAAGAGGDAMKFLSGAFFTLRGDATKAFGGIADALTAGDIKLAAQILWATLKLEWNRGVAALDAAWLGFKTAFVGIVYQATYGASSAWEEMQARFASGWINTMAALKKAAASFTGFFQSAWETVMNFLEKRWLDILGKIDPKLNVEKAKKAADERSQTTQQQIGTDMYGQRQAAEQQRVAEHNQLVHDHEQNMAGIGADYNATKSALARAANVNQDRDQAEIDRLQKELEALRERARAAAAGGPSFGAFDFRPKQQDVEAGLDDVFTKASSARGQFGGLGAAGALNSGGGVDKIVRAVRDGNDELRGLRFDMKQAGQLTFGP